jgi:uncharacterized protein (UPF0333 family)
MNHKNAKIIILALAFLLAVFIGIPYYKEGLSKKQKKKQQQKKKAAVAAAARTANVTMARKNAQQAEVQSLYDKFISVDNNGTKVEVDVMQFARTNPIQTCKDYCAKLAGCKGFTANKETEVCIFRSKKGKDVPNTNISSYWKKN